MREVTSRSLKPGDVIVHLPDADVRIIKSRKKNLTGWWVTDTDGMAAGGIADWVFDEEPNQWRSLGEVVAGYIAARGES